MSLAESECSADLFDRLFAANRGRSADLPNRSALRLPPRRPSSWTAGDAATQLWYKTTRG